MHAIAEQPEGMIDVRLRSALLLQQTATSWSMAVQLHSIVKYACLDCQHDIYVSGRPRRGDSTSDAPEDHQDTGLR